jgi:CRP-like cAMP-binding protein
VSVEIFTGTVKKNVQFKTAIMRIIRESGIQRTKKMLELKEEELIKPIVQRMETQLSEPDKVIIEKYKEGNAMYLISKGECLVIVNEESTFKGAFSSSNKKGQDEKKEKEKLLRPGYLFGEISIVYNCLTTAKIQAKKYCSLGKLSKAHYKEIITMQPKINDEIQTGIYEYDDKMLRFIKRSMKQVPYFKHLA